MARKKTPARSRSKASGSKARDIIMNDFDRELQESFEYLEQKLAGSFGGPLGKLIHKVADELFSWFIRMGGTERGRRSFEMILDEAAKVSGGNLSQVVDQALEHYLKLNEMFVRADKKHASIGRMRAALKKEFEARMKIYAPLMKEEAASYAELVRKAFPTREGIGRLMDEQFAATEEVLDMLESENGLIRIPAVVRKPVLKIVRSSYQFMRQRIEAGTDRIYS